MDIFAQIFGLFEGLFAPIIELLTSLLGGITGILG